MGSFCKNCGKELPENADVCLECGKFVGNVETVTNQQQVANIAKVKIPGNGMSIAGMVLGIIAAVWSFLKILSLGSIPAGLDEVINEYSMEVSIPFILFFFAFGYTLFSLIPSLIGLPLSIVGLVKQKTGKNIAGIVLNAVALLLSMSIFIYIMTLA